MRQSSQIDICVADEVVQSDVAIAYEVVHPDAHVGDKVAATDLVPSATADTEVTAPSSSCLWTLIDCFWEYPLIDRCQLSMLIMWHTDYGMERYVYFMINFNLFIIVPRCVESKLINF